jgi:hypothetical protein
VSTPFPPKDAGAPAAAARATGAFLTVGFIARAMNQSCETAPRVCAAGTDGARPRAAVGSGEVEDDEGCARDRHSLRQTLPSPEPIEEGIRDLVHQCREFFTAFWRSRDDAALHSLLSAWFL